MAEDGGRIEGTCLCGAVRLRATPKRRHVEACHRRMSGDAGKLTGAEVMAKFGVRQSGSGRE